jgi:hypothetical protein
MIFLGIICNGVVRKGQIQRMYSFLTFYGGDQLFDWCRIFFGIYILCSTSSSQVFFSDRVMCTQATGSEFPYHRQIDLKYVQWHQILMIILSSG